MKSIWKMYFLMWKWKWNYLSEVYDNIYIIFVWNKIFI